MADGWVKDWAKVHCKQGVGLDQSGGMKRKDVCPPSRSSIFKDMEGTIRELLWCLSTLLDIIFNAMCKYISNVAYLLPYSSL